MTIFSAGRRQEQYRHIGELTANFPLMRSEFLNHLLIKIVQFRHTFFLVKKFAGGELY